jgi:hypothetical protein
MVQRPSRLRFTLETGQNWRIAGHIIRQKLNATKPMQPRVLGFVHLTHPASAEPVKNPVTGSVSPDHDNPFGQNTAGSREHTPRLNSIALPRAWFQWAKAGT